MSIRSSGFHHFITLQFLLLVFIDRETERGITKMNTCMKVPMKERRLFQIPGARVTEGFESLDMGARNWTLNLWKNGTSFKMVNHFFLLSNHSTFSQSSIRLSEIWIETLAWDCLVTNFLRKTVVLTSTPPTRILLSKVEFKNFLERSGNEPEPH